MHEHLKACLCEEKKIWEVGRQVIGVDEVGRGAFAGPLVVGGVIFQPTKSQTTIRRLISYGIHDSKKLTKRQRNDLNWVIRSEAFFYSTSAINVNTINTFGLTKSTHLAVRKLMAKYFKQIGKPNIHLFMDAFYIPNVKGIGRKGQTGIIRGDEKSLSIAAASIIAKVERDAYMEKLANKYPGYLFEKNVGYGTAAHRAAIKEFGVTSLHRTAFIH